jgi:O-antigen/teichoic acid export membrane protein
MKEDSLKKRYAYKIFSKILTAPIIMAMQAIIPRGLGPDSYGQFTFLTNLFQQVIGFFDSGASIAFYTKLSQDNKDKSIIRFYFGFTCVVSIFIIFGTAGTFFFNIDYLLFPGQNWLYVWMAILYAVLVWISESVYKIVDAYGLTVKGELILIAQKGGALLILAGLYILGYISLSSFFTYNYIVTLFLIFLFIYYLNRNSISILKIPPLTINQLKEKISFFWSFSSPLIVYSFFGMIVGLFDNWLLVKMSGSVQQGYFGLAFRLSSISFLFTAALTQLITREFSIAHASGEKTNITNLYNRFVPTLFVVVAFLSFFFVSQAESIAYLFGGKDFKEAALPIAIMSLYPIHQTYGQLSGSLFYATGQTRQFRNIGISMIPVSLLFTWIMIAPKIYWGFGLGALGLAIKILILQFITVNIQICYNLKYLSLSFRKYFLHQIYVVSILFALSFASKFFSVLVVNHHIVRLIVSGVIYIVFSAVFFYIFPQLISKKRAELHKNLNKLQKVVLAQFKNLKIGN